MKSFGTLSADRPMYRNSSCSERVPTLPLSNTNIVKNIETKCKSENECRLHPTNAKAISGFYARFIN